MANVQQTKKLIPFITCEISFGEHVCELVLWVLVSLIVGLLPLTIILITASLSSNTYKKASWCGNWTFDESNLETVPACIVLQYYPHSNTVCIHMCDECKKSIDSGVCHRPWSILWWIMQAYLLTIEYRVVQFVPNISISEKFESMYLTILQKILFLLLWNDGNRCKEQILCRVAESSFFANSQYRSTHFFAWPALS